MTLRRITGRVIAAVSGLALVGLVTAQPLRSQARPPDSTPVLLPQDDPHSIKLPVIDGHDLRFQRMSLNQGLSQTSVSSITQDNQGFMWFGTQYGLNRYDGYKFKIFAREPGRPNSLSGVFIRSLFKDRDETLWVGCDQFLDKFDPVTETFTHYSIRARDESGAGATVMQISQDRTGVLWLSTKTGLYSLEPANGRIARYVHDPNDPHSLSSSNIEWTGEDREGKLWVASTDGLDAFDPATGTVLIHIPAHSQGRELSFFEDSFGVFWIFHASGGGALSVYARRTNKLTRYAFDPPAGSEGDVIGFVSILEDRNRNLWLGTTNDGLYRFDRKNQRFIRYRNEPNNGESLADDQVLDLFQDREGNIWVGLEQVAPNYFSTTPPPFERFVHQPGAANNLGASLVSNIFEDREGILWVSSNSSLNRIDRKTGDNHLVFSRFNDEIHDMLETRSGDLWAATGSHGIQRIDEASGQFKGSPDPLFESSNADRTLVSRLLIGSDGTIWATTWSGLRHFDLARHRYAVYKPDLQRLAEFYAIAQDSQGVLWIGGKEGLYRFDPATGRFKIYSHNPADPHSLSDSQVDSVHFDNSGTMWVGTQDGLDRFVPNTGGFEIFRDRDGLPGNAVSCILSDSRDNLWMSTNNGISKFDPQSRRFRNYTVADGLSGPDLTGWGACFKSRSGEMFFGGFSGATGFYPDEVVESTTVPRVVLTGFSLADVPVDVGPHSLLQKAAAFTERVTLSHRQNIFSIEFSSLSYLNTVENRYRYRLEGLEDIWHEAAIGQRQVGYTTLPANKYAFRVQGSIRGGPWGEPGTVLQITVLPAWWNTWWFRTLYIFAILLSVLGAYLVQSHRIAMQHNMRLTARVNERNRIARELHDTLLQSFQGLLLRFQTAYALFDTRPADAKEVLGSSIDQTAQAITEGREAVQGLRASTVESNDLAQAITTLGEQLAAEAGNAASVGLHVAVEGTPRNLHPIVRDEIYRIASEALRNAFRHAEAQRIEVDLRYDERQLRLRIRDDGKGIENTFLTAEGRTGHFGLPGMRERAKLMGGEMTVWTAAQSGTEIELIIRADRAYAASPRRSWFAEKFSGKSAQN